MKPSGPGQSALLLSEVVFQLDELGIAYAVVGALAASFHGIVRSSLDADAVISPGGEQDLVQQLIARLLDQGLEVDHRPGSFDDPIDSVVAISDRHGNRVDLLTGIQGLDPDFGSRTIAAPLFGTSLKIIGIEDFVAMKAFAGSPRDLEDALGVMKVSADSIDYVLLKKLAVGYGREASATLDHLTRALKRPDC